MLYRGSCHCGQVAFEVGGELDAAIACNCSICSRKGALLWAVPHDNLRLFAAGDTIGTYVFNNHVIEHRFCRSWGIHPFAEDIAGKSPRSAYVNIRCRTGIDLASIPVIEFDGRSV